MTTFDRISRLSPWLIVAGAVGAAALVGLAITKDPRYGVMALGGLVFAAAILVDLPIAVAVWIVALCLAGVPETKGAPTGTTVVLIAGCLGTIVDRKAFALRSTHYARAAYLSTLLIVLWSAATLIWAPDGAVVKENLRIYVVAVASLPIIVTSCVNARGLMIVVGAVVAGATIGVVAGVASGTSSAPVDRLASFEPAAGRLSAGNNDPNFLGAYVVVALLLLIGLLGVRELRRWRIPMLVPIPILLGGLVATQSRGAIIAAAAGAVIAAVIVKDYRKWIGVGVGVAVVLLAAFLVAQPRAVDRLTQSDSTGTGRTELWNMALGVANDHPVLGVGIGNFRVVEARYIDDGGFVTDPGMFLNSPLVTHDIWLQALVETGIIGLLLQLAVLAACIAASFRAVKRFRRLDRPDLANLARTIGVGQLTFVIASTFLASGADRVFWVILALGPAALAVAGFAVERADDEPGSPDEDDPPRGRATPPPVEGARRPSLVGAD